MQPFVFNRQFYEKTLFKSIKMIEAHLQLIGFQVDRKAMCKVLKSVETPTLEKSAQVAAGLYQIIRTPKWKDEMKASAKLQESAGQFPHFIIEGDRKFTIQLQKIVPTDAAWQANRLERL